MSPGTVTGIVTGTIVFRKKKSTFTEPYSF
jgi:hypothetical protein